MQTKTIIENYVSAFTASDYKVQLIHADRNRYKPILITYTPEQLVKSAGFLRHKNALGYNIYCRPIGYQFVLLDDLKRDVLADLAAIKPCLLMETSPDNFQAFVTLKQIPENRDQALEVCRQLAYKFNADIGSAEPDHVGRLPGFTNRKEKYKNDAGLYPFVKLHGSEQRTTTFIPQWGACAYVPAIRAPAKTKTENDRSTQDFNLVCKLLKLGNSDEVITDALLNYSDKAKERGIKYINKTIKNAKQIIRL